MYISVAEAAEKWGVTPRQVQRLLADNRIPNARKFGRSWQIPQDAPKPGDLRYEKETPAKALSSDLASIVAATTLPMPRHDPDAILDTVKEERLRLQYEGELAYLRGDFEHTKRCYIQTEGDEAARLRASSAAIAAAISMGDYPLYLEIENFLKGVAQANKNPGVSGFVELCLSNAYVSACALNMVPGWLKEGDFSALPPQAKPDAAYKRAKYFQFLGQYETMLAIAQTTLEFCVSESGIAFHDIYFRVLCSMACCALGCVDEAKRWLMDSLKTALPHGFITPFAESATAFGGLLEECLMQAFPEYHDAAIGQWERTFTNWRSFHNHFTKDNITLMLSLRDYQIAQLAAQGVPYKQIAAQFHMSLGTLNNKMQVIYETLLITDTPRRKQLEKYIW